MLIEPPIIIVGDGQVELFASAAALEGAIEAVDAKLYRAYDSRGHALRLTGVFREGTTLGLRWVKNASVALEPIAEVSPRTEELRAELLDWWRRTAGSGDASSWSLEDLVSAVAKRDGVR